jgi:CheY-like chemotaxis protein
MNMPNYDGGYALEKITQDFPEAKIIVVTAFTDYKFDKTKAVAVFTKPYDFEPFIDTIKKVTLKHRTPKIIS